MKFSNQLLVKAALLQNESTLHYKWHRCPAILNFHIGLFMFVAGYTGVVAVLHPWSKKP